MSIPDLNPALRQLQSGGIVVLLLPDGAADLLMSGEHARTGRIAFYVRHTSGMIQAALTADRCDELDLPPMATLPRSEASAVAVDAAVGVTTGISAADRARAIRILADLQIRSGGPAPARTCVAAAGTTAWRA
ncbi:3,4-dihydroxy-2-butanone-4-phosphate synthase [Mycobacterium sp. pUA109]|uniref:3,4-dihydroxy-2-butanone-4-phosphate synthase n=1 Tax=Mycobacterium sp. pUA109 TaxID=3238982 RepID=UPI00351B2ACB